MNLSLVKWPTHGHRAKTKIKSKESQDLSGVFNDVLNLWLYILTDLSLCAHQGRTGFNLEAEH